MILPPATDTAWPLVGSMLGRRVVARPATVRWALIGTVVEVDGSIVVVRTCDGLDVAVHVIDIDPASLIESDDASVLSGCG